LRGSYLNPWVSAPGCCFNRSMQHTIVWAIRWSPRPGTAQACRRGCSNYAPRCRPLLRAHASYRRSRN